jgi:hypothetical protein
MPGRLAGPYQMDFNPVVGRIALYVVFRSETGNQDPPLRDARSDQPLLDDLQRLLGSTEIEAGTAATGDIALEANQDAFVPPGFIHHPLELEFHFAHQLSSPRIYLDHGKRRLATRW